MQFQELTDRQTTGHDKATHSKTCQDGQTKRRWQKNHQRNNHLRLDIRMQAERDANKIWR